MDYSESEQAAGQSASNVEAILAEVDFEALPEFADMIGFIKYCPTPDGKGVHMVLNTERGPVTVILMPATAVDDRESHLANGMQMRIVSLSRGSTESDRGHPGNPRGGPGSAVPARLSTKPPCRPAPPRASTRSRPRCLRPES